jgi:hypothetical protein
MTAKRRNKRTLASQVSMIRFANREPPGPARATLLREYL